MQKLQEEISDSGRKEKLQHIVNYQKKLTVLQYALERHTHCDAGKISPAVHKGGADCHQNWGRHKLYFEFSIGFEEAKKYRNANGQILRRNQW